MLSNKNIIVTGSSSGIGLSITKTLLKNKANVIGISRRTPNFSNKNYQHIGVYHYSVSALKKFCELKRTKNEIKNKLEQLRALDNNIPINVILAKKQVIGIDTKEDYMELKKILEYKA